ncbi:MAG: hypothetical protein EOP19_11615 [Hyphomicrobiales bacterium]|nr:MAG: hypothetical protein EOP19_11615 [Hyphomicrobiales bacterium]
MSDTLLHCRCGRVEVALTGDPILTAACHCDDCQAGSAKLEALPGAWALRDASGGTWYALYRKDRYRVTRGAELLRPDKLRPGTPTNRVFASCCNSGLFVSYDSGLHWVSIYRPGFGADALPLEMRVNTKFATVPLPDDVPAYRTFPLSFVWRLVKARVAMLLG